MDDNAKTEALKKQFLVKGNESLAAQLAAVAEVVSVPRDGVLIEEGDARNEIYFVLSGAFGVFLAGGQIGRREAGIHVGEMAMVDQGSKRSATVAALEDSKAAKVTYEDFARLANENPSLWHGIAIDLTRRIRQMNEWLAVNLKETVPEYDEEGVEMPDPE